jgi:hypothetical protein
VGKIADGFSTWLTVLLVARKRPAPELIGSMPDRDTKLRWSFPVGA